MKDKTITIPFKIFYEGGSIKHSLDFEEKEFKYMSQEEKEHFIREEIFKHINNNMELEINYENLD